MSNHVDSDRAKRAPGHLDVDDNSPSGRHLILGTHLARWADCETAIVAEVDIQGLIQEILQVGSIKPDGIPAQEVEVLGCASGQPEP